MINDLSKDEKEQLKLLYNKEIHCPVCDSKFHVKAVKSSSYRLNSKDSDFFLRYALINPYFYDVWLCNECGYSALKVDFPNIRRHQKQLVLDKISPKWKRRYYDEVFNVDIAIERYKLALLNYTLAEGKASQKAMTCLKLAWMYRLKNNNKSEETYLTNALKGFIEAYESEEFPIFGMDKYTIMYLIGELNRRLGDKDKALLWFSYVITTPNVSYKLKSMARDQRDLIKEEEIFKNKNLADSTSEKSHSNDKGWISKLFR
ncbi:DUF2225 domain-containing protein [Clostridium tetani]|uniref:Conserved protein n=1 Tax=Clostridium tetani (strain Massachusetts / E88) TaxID=212717 RepID=Q898V4_CLOTE|nr:DUF2225 domain-containing protein [Clostridium tetani]AAO34975.1 conserved protein [Clostridium tetani E88]KGI37358.1 hypothetical protein LA33_10865 [Clostridium tetani ATCC 9441]KGI40764.1 hypothetical protein KY52_03190 [Clostridium tetani]KGI42220.1 hypothetical protein KY54_13420 [Clostridium tetani]KHO38270.1 hypothetical protein OR63_01525 [Clostridium tetani]